MGAEGEGRYRSLFLNMLDGCAYCQAVYDENRRMVDWRYLEVNDAFVRLTGLRPVPGTLVSSLIPGIRESDRALFEAYERVASGGPPERFENEVAALGLWFSVSAYCPEPGYFIASFEVINERRAAEASLRDSEAKLRRLFEIMPVGMSVLGKDRTYIATNPALARILRLPPEGLEAATSRAYVDAEGRPMPSGAFPSVMAAAERKAVENVGVGIDLETGERIWVEVSAVPAAVADWDIVLSVTDVSELKRTQERLAASLEEKAVLFKELQHRVKNNLEIVSSVLALGIQGAGDDGARRVLEDACSRVGAMEAIYETLVYTDRVDRVELDRYIGSFLEAIHETYSIDRASVRFDARLEAMDIDARRAVSLCLALNELVTNSLKYAYEPRAGGTITVELTKADGSIALRVSDEGRGLPPGTDASTAPSVGLTLVRHLASQLGGRFEAESEPGRGTRAELIIPG